MGFYLGIGELLLEDFSFLCDLRGKTMDENEVKV